MDRYITYFQFSLISQPENLGVLGTKPTLVLVLRNRQKISAMPLLVALLVTFVASTTSLEEMCDADDNHGDVSQHENLGVLGTRPTLVLVLRNRQKTSAMPLLVALLVAFLVAFAASTTSLEEMCDADDDHDDADDVL